jgi:transposase
MEGVTGPTGRRRWAEHGKAALVPETFGDGVSVADVAADVARTHGVSAPQLQAWRRGGAAAMPQDDAPGLVGLRQAAGVGTGASRRGRAC